jgi:hypothetical protein
VEPWLAKLETVPAGETHRLRFNKFDTTAPPTLARVTITSP